jgi:hypothetical protein
MLARAATIFEREKGIRMTHARFAQLLDTAIPDEAAGAVSCEDAASAVIVMTSGPDPR